MCSDLGSHLCFVYFGHRRRSPQMGSFPGLSGRNKYILIRQLWSLWLSNYWNHPRESRTSPVPAARGRKCCGPEGSWRTNLSPGERFTTCKMALKLGLSGETGGQGVSWLDDLNLSLSSLLFKSPLYVSLRYWMRREAVEKSWLLESWEFIRVGNFLGRDGVATEWQVLKRVWAHVAETGISSELFEDKERIARTCSQAFWSPGRRQGRGEMWHQFLKS